MKTPVLLYLRTFVIKIDLREDWPKGMFLHHTKSD